MKKVREILPSPVVMENIKEKTAEIRLDDKGNGSTTLEVSGYLNFIQIKKQFDNIGEPVITVTSDKLVEPILKTTVKKSAIYPVRFMGSDVGGEPLNILSQQNFKMALNDTIKIQVSNGLANSRIEVLVRYGRDN